MYYENCGASLRENAKFCDQCGALVHIGEKENCQHCHAELEPGELFCPECGYRVMEEPAPEPVPDPTPRQIQSQTQSQIRWNSRAVLRRSHC